MKNLSVTAKKRQSGFKTSAIVALVAFSVSACSTSPKSMWQGEEVLVEARQDVLERDVTVVNDNHRELQDRFDALERLYVELVANMREQERKMAMLQSHVDTVKKDPELQRSMLRFGDQMSSLQQQIKSLENRLYSVEVNDATFSGLGNMPSLSNAKTTEVAPTGTSVTSASTSAANTATGTPVQAAPAKQDVFYGVHLASFRSKNQVESGWAGLEQTFGDDLEGLIPLVYTQSQEGIGTFLRLIAGPLMTEKEAEDLCARVRRVETDQYCRPSEYQGEPIG